MTSNYSFKSMVKKYVNSSAVLIICTIFALILANSPLKEGFFSFWNNEVSLSIGEFNLFSHNGHSMTLIQVINDFLMAIFFLSVGLEIKREILVGELSSAKKAMLPIIGACGGMLIPVFFFWLTCPDNPDMLRGVAIPMATDIAFSLGVLSIFDKRVPIGLKIFLAALAVADDLGGIIVIALFYSSTIDLNYIQEARDSSHQIPMANQEDESYVLRMGEQKEVSWESGDPVGPLHPSWTICLCLCCDTRKIILLSLMSL